MKQNNLNKIELNKFKKDFKLNFTFLFFIYCVVLLWIIQLNKDDAGINTMYNLIFSYSWILFILFFALAFLNVPIFKIFKNNIKLILKRKFDYRNIENLENLFLLLNYLLTIFALIFILDWDKWDGFIFKFSSIIAIIFANYLGNILNSTIKKYKSNN
jgi:hypothetical protein